MKLALILLIIVLFTISSGCTSKEKHLWLMGDIIVYDGAITIEGVKDLIHELNYRKLKHFYINSFGGSSEEGLKIAEYIQKNNIAVTVIGRCYSSCANYIFLASKNRSLIKNSKIGLHGGYQSVYPRMISFMETLPKELTEDYQKSIDTQKLRMNKEISILIESKINPEIIQASATMTYYGDINYIVKLNGEDKKFILGKKDNSGYELWFPHESEYRTWGINFNTINPPSNYNNFLDKFMSSKHDNIEISRKYTTAYREGKL